MLIIWGRKNSINVQKVLWCLDELGLAYERREAGGTHGVVDTPEYKALNPNGKVPTLVDGDFVLWESNAILRYLGHRYGGDPLWPDDPVVRADADRWMDWHATTHWPDLRFVFWSLVRTPERERDHGAIQRATEAAGSTLAMLDQRLADRDYVAGADFTLGDIPVGAGVHRWFALNIQRPDLPNLERWYRRLGDRQAYRRHVMLPLS